MLAQLHKRACRVLAATAAGAMSIDVQCCMPDSCVARVCQPVVTGAAGDSGQLA